MEMNGSMNDEPELIEGRPGLGIAALLGIVGLAALGHFWMIPAVESYVEVAACDRWLGMNGLSGLLMIVTAGAGLGVLLLSILASRYWARVSRSGQLPPPGALVIRRTRPVRLDHVPTRAKLARYLPHLGGIILALCVAMGVYLHTGLVHPNLEQLQALCRAQP